MDVNIKIAVSRGCLVAENDVLWLRQVMLNFVKDKNISGAGQSSENVGGGGGGVRGRGAMDTYWYVVSLSS